MARGRGFGLDMRSSSTRGSWGRIKHVKILYSISEIQNNGVASINCGYERIVEQQNVGHPSCLPWSRKLTNKWFKTNRPRCAAPDPNCTAPPLGSSAQCVQMHEQTKKWNRINRFVATIRNSYKRIMQSAQDSNIQLRDLFPSNHMLAQCTPAAGNRSTKALSPSPGVGRPSFVCSGEDSFVKDSISRNGWPARFTRSRI